MPYPELEELYNTYRTDLYRYLCHLTHDPAEAEDLLSETFCGRCDGCTPTAEIVQSRPGCSALPTTSGWKACASAALPSAPTTC